MKKALGLISRTARKNKVERQIVGKEIVHFQLHIGILIALSRRKKGLSGKMIKHYFTVSVEEVSGLD